MAKENDETTAATKKESANAEYVTVVAELHTHRGVTYRKGDKILAGPNLRTRLRQCGAIE